MNAGDVLRQFYSGVARRDIASARKYLSDNLVFKGLFQTYRNAEEYLAALKMLLQITVRLTVKAIIAEGNDGAIFFELETRAPPAATTLVAEWHQIEDGKIFRVQSAFDGRPFAGMFASGKGTQKCTRPVC